MYLCAIYVLFMYYLRNYPCEVCIYVLLRTYPYDMSATRHMTRRFSRKIYDTTFLKENMNDILEMSATRHTT
jgi:hypothetical protein